MKVKLESYSGYRGEQEPRAFHLDGRRLQVSEIVDRWIEPGMRWYKCLAEDGNMYIIRHEEEADDWELVSFTHARRVQS